MLSMLKQLWKDEEGATAVEYGLILALIAAAIMVAVGTLGENLNTQFKKIADEIPGGGGE